MITWEDYVQQSLLIQRETHLWLLYLGLTIGLACITHSVYIHVRKFSIVRVACDLCTLALIGETICFLACAEHACSATAQVLVYNWLGDGLFGVIVIISDCYLSFQRYALLKELSGTPVSRTLSALATLWVCGVMIMSWWVRLSIFN